LSAERRPDRARCPQRERYLIPAIRGDRRSAFCLTEPDHGSDVRGIRTTAIPSPPGDYRLRGEKWFVTGGDVVESLIVLAAAEPGRRLTLFLVGTDSPGFHVERLPQFTQVHVLAHPEIRLGDLEVGAEAVLGEVGVRADQGLVRRGATPGRRALCMGGGASAPLGGRLGEPSRSVRPVPSTYSVRLVNVDFRPARLPASCRMGSGIQGRARGLAQCIEIVALEPDVERDLKRPTAGGARSGADLRSGPTPGYPESSRGPDRSFASPRQVSMKGNGSARRLWNCLLDRHHGDMETSGRSYSTAA
jgi:hypothetical protein